MKIRRLSRRTNLKIYGRAEAVFNMIDIIANTEEIEKDPFWWSARAKVLAHDQDREEMPSHKERRN